MVPAQAEGLVHPHPVRLAGPEDGLDAGGRLVPDHSALGAAVSEEDGEHRAFGGGWDYRVAVLPGQGRGRRPSFFDRWFVRRRFRTGRTLGAGGGSFCGKVYAHPILEPATTMSLVCPSFV